MNCPKCGAGTSPGANFCALCGTFLAGRKKKCGRCRNEYDLDVIYCENCGTLLDTVDSDHTSFPLLIRLSMVSFYNGDLIQRIPDSIGSLSFYNDNMIFLSITEPKPRPVQSGEDRQTYNNGRIIRYSDIESVEQGTKMGIPCLTIRFKNDTACVFSKVGTQLRDAARFLELHLQ